MIDIGNGRALRPEHGSSAGATPAGDREARNQELAAGRQEDHPADSTTRSRIATRRRAAHRERPNRLRHRRLRLTCSTPGSTLCAVAFGSGTLTRPSRSRGGTPCHCHDAHSFDPSASVALGPCRQPGSSAAAGKRWLGPRPDRSRHAGGPPAGRHPHQFERERARARRRGPSGDARRISGKVGRYSRDVAGVELPAAIARRVGHGLTPRKHPDVHGFGLHTDRGRARLRIPGQALVNGAPSYGSPNRTARQIGADVREVPLLANLNSISTGWPMPPTPRGMVFLCNPTTRPRRRMR